MPTLTILHTNDIHGQLEPFLRGTAQLTQLRRELEIAGNQVLLVDGGDVEDRSLLESDLSKGIAMFRLLKAAHYDASAVGNGAALSYGPAVLAPIAAQSKMPLICANLLDPETLQPVPGTLPTLILQRGDLKIGLIGVTDPLRGMYLRFFNTLCADPLEIVTRYEAELRESGCQVVGLLSHLGKPQDITLAETFHKLDFIIGGHSHDLLTEPLDIAGTPLCQAGDRGRYFGRLDLHLDEHFHVTSWTGRVIEIDQNGEFASEPAAEWEKVRAEAQDQLNETIAQIPQAYELVYAAPCPMGTLMGEALRDIAGTEIGLCVTGHLHTGLKAGALTRRELMEAVRSPSNPIAIDLTGQQIVDLVQAGANPENWQRELLMFRGSKVGVIQAAGLTYAIDENGYVNNLLIGGQPLDSAQIYTVASTDYPFFSGHKTYAPTVDLDQIKVVSGDVVREVMETYLKKHYPVK